MNGTRRMKWCWKEEFPTKKMFTLLGNMAEVGHRSIFQISLTERQILNCPRRFKGGLKGNLETILWPHSDWHAFFRARLPFARSVLKEAEDGQASSLETRGSFCSTNDLNLHWIT